MTEGNRPVIEHMMATTPRLTIEEFEKTPGMKKTFMKIGIMSKDAYRKRTIAIAKGEYRPGDDEPKVWFESMESLGQILNDQNQKLLRLIKDRRPASLTEIEAISGRKKSNLSTTLKTLTNLGIVA